jgi:small subunit ribosomal protein S2
MNDKKMDVNIDEMKKAGVFFGHKAFKCHPKMKPFILGVRGSDHINIIDLDQTIIKLKEAMDFISSLIKEKKVIVFVGTSPGVQEIIKEAAMECKMPYVENRWIGGTISNFEVMKKRVDHMKDLERKKAAGELEKYTKKEQAGFDKEISDLNKKFGGIKEMDKLPDAFFVINTFKEKIAIKEAKAKGIPTIAIVDTDSDPSIIDYPIPANDDAASAVRYIVDRIKESCK